jgi:hypothetical protein
MEPLEGTQEVKNEGTTVGAIIEVIEGRDEGEYTGINKDKCEGTKLGIIEGKIDGNKDKE